MDKPVIGQQATFIEHLVVLNDLDSGDEFPATYIRIEGCEDVENRLEKQAVRDHEWMFGGNTVEAEYQGTTGKTVLAEYKDVRGKGRWVTIKELTPCDINIDNLHKLN